MTGGRRVSNRAKDPLTHAVVEAIDASGLHLSDVAKRSLVSENVMYAWRSGRASANCHLASCVLEALGLRVMLVPLGG
jgi:DNA-binding phage protein